MSTDLAWLAGIIDGEGTVNLHRGPKGQPRLQVHIYANAGPVLTRTREVLEQQSEIPYSIATDARALSGFINHQIILSTRASIALYPLVSPYLVRQIERYTLGCEMIMAHHASGHAIWTTEDKDAWNDLRIWCSIGRAS